MVNLQIKFEAQKRREAMSTNFSKNRKNIPANTLIVGVDIGKKKNCYQAVTGNGEFQTKKGEWFENKNEGFNSFIVQVEKWKNETGCDKILVGMEPTGPYWIPFSAFLEGKGIKAVFVNPYHVKKTKEQYDNSPLKSDPKDALLIARMVGEGKYLKPVVLDENFKKIRKLFKYRQSLVGQKVSIVNRIKSELAECFPELEEIFSDFDGKAIRAVLKACPLPCDILTMGEEKLTCLLNDSTSGRVGQKKAAELLKAASSSAGAGIGSDGCYSIISSMAENLDYMITQIAKIEKELKICLKETREYKILSSIPGVSFVTVSSILAVAGDLRNYASASELIKLLGLNVYEISSGKHRGVRRISKRGLPWARNHLYEAAAANCREGGFFRDNYLAMRKRGKPSSVIFIAFVCKLVKLMFAMVRDDSLFKKAENNGKKHLRAAA